MSRRNEFSLVAQKYEACRLFGYCSVCVGELDNFAIFQVTIASSSEFTGVKYWCLLTTAV